MKLKTENEFMQVAETQAPDRFIPQPPHSLPINEAIQIQAAEYWLKLGEADQALRELEHLPQNTWNSPAALKIRVAAIGMLRERRELEAAL